MTPISDTQEFARRFNEEEAIWQRFQRKRLTRRLLEEVIPHARFVKQIRHGVLARSQFPNVLADIRGSFSKPAGW